MPPISQQPKFPIRLLPLTRLGFVGLGWWAGELAQAARRAGLTIEAACDPDPERLQAFCETFSVRGFLRLEDLLADPDVTNVVIATPHSQHAAQAIAAAKAGKHVFVEKPLTLTPADADAVITACRAASVTLAVGHNRRLLSGFAQIREMTISGQLGPIQAIEATYATSEALRFSPDHWRSQPSECPMGPMTVLGPHMVDWMITLAGSVTDTTLHLGSPRPDRLTPDSAVLQLRFQSGALGSLTCLYTSSYDCRFTVHGDRATARLIASAPDAPDQRPLLTVTTLHGVTESLPVPWVDSLAIQLTAFAAGRPVVDGAAALAIIKALHAAKY